MRAFERVSLLAILATLGVSVSLFLLRRRRPELLAVWLSYLVILAPNSGLVRIGDQIAADRYSYMAMMGGVALAAAGLCRSFEALRRLRPAAVGLTAACLGVLLGLTLLTRAQCRTWRTSEALWTHVLRHGEYRGWVAHNNLGVALSDQGRFAEAVAQYTEGLKIKPDDALARNNLGFALLRLGRLDEAIAWYTAALQIDPNYVKAHYNLGSALRQQGRLDEARAQYAEALRINPGDGDAHISLGMTLRDQGRLDEALAQYAAALRIDLDAAIAHNNCAMIWAAAPEAKYRDGRRAVAAATRACELTHWNSPGFLDTLAAASAEADDFDSAARWQTRAIDLLKDEATKADFRSRLELYQARQPYREATGKR
jgi:Flp pilus assembly protein TadD